MQISPGMAGFILAMLERTPIHGREAEAMAQCKAALRHISSPPTDTDEREKIKDALKKRAG